MILEQIINFLLINNYKTKNRKILKIYLEVN